MGDKSRLSNLELYRIIVIGGAFLIADFQSSTFGKNVGFYQETQNYL